MPIRTLAQRNALASAYATAAPFGCLFSADPGTAGAATGELTGGSPVYARVAMAWGAAANSAVSGSPTFNVASGSTPQVFKLLAAGPAAAPGNGAAVVIPAGRHNTWAAIVDSPERIERLTGIIEVTV